MKTLFLLFPVLLLESGIMLDSSHGVPLEKKEENTHKVTTAAEPCEVHNSYNMISSPRPKVYVTSTGIDVAALDLLRKSCEVDIWDKPHPIPKDELCKAVKDKDALFSTVVLDKEIIDAAENLKVIGTFSVGLNHIDLEAVKARNIKLGNTPDVLTYAMVEATVGLTIATARRFFETHNEIRSGSWGKLSFPGWKNGVEIRNSVIGIVGLGRIGHAVAETLLAFKPSKIVYYGTRRKPEGDKLGAEFVSLDRLLEESDFVIVTCALNENTKGLIGAESFKKMKNTAIFINVSRGGIIQQDALMDALKTGQIRAAGLDVMTPEPLPKDHPLLDVPNLTLLPHIGSATTATRRDMAVLTAKNILAGLKNEPMPAPVC